jgi:hypothetical protein
VGDAGARQHKVRRTAARQGSDAWDHRKQEVVLESLRRRSAAKHGSGRPQTTWRGQAVASARSGKATVERGRARGRAQSGAEAAEAAHMAGAAAAACDRENRGKGERGRRRRTQMQYHRNAGTLL